MVYDIERDQLASPDVFDVRVEPKEGEFVKFDTFFTQYVGDGVTPPPAKPESSDSERSGEVENSGADE